MTDLTHEDADKQTWKAVLKLYLTKHPPMHSWWRKLHSCHIRHSTLMNRRGGAGASFPDTAQGIPRLSPRKSPGSRARCGGGGERMVVVGG